MTYEPRTAKTRWMRDAVLAALRQREMTTTELVAAIWTPGSHFTSATLQGAMVAMERHDEIVRSRPHSSAVYRWRLGAGAPEPVDLSWAELPG
jgi:hypothetical protein